MRLSQFVNLSIAARLSRVLAWVLTSLMAVSCADEVAVTGAVAVDAKTASADVAVDAAVNGASAGAMPTLDGQAHSAEPYVEIAGLWNAEAQRVQVVVWLGGFTDLLGIAAHLTYDPDKLELVAQQMLDPTQESASTGFLWRGLVKEVAPGRLVTGIARFRAISHPYAYPDGTDLARAQWLSLEFVVKSTGKSTIGFDLPTRLARRATGEPIAAQWLTAEVDVPATFVIGGAP